MANQNVTFKLTVRAANVIQTALWERRAQLIKIIRPAAQGEMISQRKELDEVQRILRDEFDATLQDFEDHGY